MEGPAFPQFRPVADHALLVEFGAEITASCHADVLRLDAVLARAGFDGFVQAVPAYVNLLVEFDPLRTDHAAVKTQVETLLESPAQPGTKGAAQQVEVCYDPAFAPDLASVAAATGLTPDAVIALHLAGAYEVYLYGFAPGYAYLSGLPAPLHLPRKPSAVRGVPAGSVLIAGGQCIVSTLTMPTGWWVIGRSPTPILLDDPARPFLFDVGDRVTFRRIDRATFDSHRK